MNTDFLNKRIVIIAQVWPESASSAAGRRMLQLLEVFQMLNMQIFIGSTANKTAFSDDLSTYGVVEFKLWLNDLRSDQILKDLDPDIVLFDRFMIEEQFSWRVFQQCPNAMTILDTEDLHFLRSARQKMYSQAEKDLNKFIYSDKAKRELASIMRCDLTLLISDFEFELLTNVFQVASDLLLVLPFLEQVPSKEIQSKWPSFQQREGFVFIGNFIHEPNWQTVLYLKKVIWPKLSKQLPGVNLHIYGAYATQKVLDLHNKKQRFLVHGRADNAQAVISQTRVMLAPIVFGAGIKGKFIDSIHAGTPNISSELGAEAMHIDNIWPGFICRDEDQIIQNAVLLYNDEKLWKEKQTLGEKLIKLKFNKQLYYQIFTKKLDAIFNGLAAHRNRHFLQQVFKHHSAQSTKYMALWIEQKNKTL
ncbi:glycosyltransferase [Myroides sp. LJL119]